MWIIPTRNRPQAMKGLIEAMQETGQVPVCAVMQDGLAYDIDWPKHWKIHRSSAHLEMQRAVNALFELYPHEDCYGLLTDSSRPLTQGWSTMMEEAAGFHFIAYPNSVKNKAHARTRLPRLNNWCMGGDFARALGWLLPPFLVHLYTDDVMDDIAHALNIARYVEDAQILPLLVRDGDIARDENHERKWRGRPYMEADKKAYEIWKQQEFARLIERLSAFRVESNSLRSAAS